jgi:hypothetical protein
MHKQSRSQNNYGAFAADHSRGNHTPYLINALDAIEEARNFKPLRLVGIYFSFQHRTGFLIFCLIA